MYRFGIMCSVCVGRKKFLRIVLFSAEQVSTQSWCRLCSHSVNDFQIF